MKHLPVILAMIWVSFSSCAEEVPVVSMKALNAGTAHKAAETAFMECSGRGYHVAVAVTDRQGNLLSFIRSPLAGAHTIAVSQRKAYTAATYRSATSSMMQQQHLAHSPGVLLLGGGLPIQVAGEFYGAIAVSGAPGEKQPGDVDEACAQAGIDAISEAIEFGAD